MRKTLFYILLPLALVLAVSLPGLMAAEVPCEIEITPDSDANPLFDSVTFSHEVHADLQCNDCHHMFEGSGSIDSCRMCHMDRDPDYRAEATSFYYAWHGRSEVSCFGCHYARKYRHEEHGPIKCFNSGCHTN